MKNLALMAGFNTIYWRFVTVAYFFGPPCLLATLHVFQETLLTYASRDSIAHTYHFE